MKVFPDKLEASLAKRLPPVVIVSGDEPLIHMEACDTVRRVARERGIEEREVLHVESGFQWTQLLESAASLSLFASQKLIEVRLGGQSPGQDGGKALEAYAEQASGSDNVLLLSSQRLDRKAQSSKWFKALDKLGLFVPVWPVDHQRLVYWMRDRANLHGLNLDWEAARLLGERTEGNLLAADQELKKLALLLPPNARLDVDAIASGVESSARYDVFALTDACLRGERERVVRIVTGLKQEGVEAPVVLWALTRELRILLSIFQHLDQGQSLEHACKAQRPMIPEKRRPGYKQALNRLPQRRLHKLLMFAQRIDLAVKGAVALPLWDALGDLALTLAGGRGLLAEMAYAYRTT
ncbi:DNA polymerase III subunit delta [Salinicola halophilus]|uniref:DNA polymerase III subunit delta n=1 Tax=Salinicola halophilus TaxID=184065 RepID=UPI000DA22DDF|nr:DNA polymerase III subunit delta [Salinicola halophilus]